MMFITPRPPIISPTDEITTMKRNVIAMIERNWSMMLAAVSIAKLFFSPNGT